MENRNTVLRRLRELYEKNEVRKNGNECAELLHELAYFHHETDKWSLVCKCSLLNGVLVGTGSKNRKEQVRTQLRELGESILRSSNRNDVDFDIVEYSLKQKKKFTKKRIEIAEKLSDIQPIPIETCGSDLMSKENEIIQQVRFLMREISEFYAERMEEISRKCIEVLGKPPCEFSHFAMGSLARQEITLYSDFENAIILGEGVDWNESSRKKAIEYFRWYAVLFDMILINFGETPISLIGIEGLNDHYSTDKSNNWFYDSFITCGIMFDSCLPYASKNPFGRKPTYNKPDGAELILPADEMLQYVSERKTLQEGYHLTNMLLESRHIAGDNNLFERFRNGYMKMANDLRKSIPYIQQDLRYAREDLEKYNLSPDFRTLGWTQHAKKSFYRPMSVHIPFLSRLFGEFGHPSTSHIVDNLKKNSGLSEEVTHNLLYAVAVANLVRLKVYSDRDRQSDRLTGAVSLIDDTSQIMNVFDAVGDRSALDYYEISLGLRNAVIEIVDAADNKLLRNEPIDGSIAVACFQKHLKGRWDLKLHGDIYRRFQNFEKAIQSYETALTTTRKEDGMFFREQECEILLSLGLTNLYALKFHDSFTWCKSLIDLEKKLQRGNVSQSNIATALTMSGHCITEIPSMRSEYPSKIDEAEDIWQRLLSTEPENKDFIKGLAELRDTEAFYFLRTGQYGESLTKYEEAKVLFSRYFGQNIVNNDTIKVENGIAICLLHLKRFEESVEIFDRVLSQKRNLIGKEVADVNISWYLRRKGLALSSLGKYEEAVDAFEESIKIRSRAPGSLYDICAASANTARFLAECHFRFKNYEEAIISSERVLKLVEKIPETDKGKEFKEMAEKIIHDSKENLSLD